MTIAKSVLLISMTLNYPFVFVMLLHHDQIMPLLQLIMTMLVTMMMMIVTMSAMLSMIIITMMVRVGYFIRTMMMMIVLQHCYM